METNANYDSSVETNIVAQSNKKHSRKTLFGLLIAGGVLVISLSACANTDVDYSLYDIHELDDDYAALYEEYKANPNPDDYEPYELVNIALYKYELEDDHHSEAYGEVRAAGVDQTTHGVYLKEGGSSPEYFNEIISSTENSLLGGTINNALRIFEYSDGSAVQYSGTPIKRNKAEKAGQVFGTVATFDEDKVEYFDNTNALEDHLGRSLSRATNHIISSKTVTDQTMEHKSSGGYTIDVTLDPIKGVVRYVRQMMVCGNLNNAPIFNSMWIEFELTEDIELISAAYHEDYEVNIIGFDFHGEGVTTEWFHHNEKYEPGIPTDFDTPINYTDWEEY